MKLQSAQLQAEQKVTELAKRVEETLPEKLAGAEQRRQQGIGKVVEKAREEVSQLIEAGWGSKYSSGLVMVGILWPPFWVDLW